MSLPPSTYIAIGAVLAALVAGLFSFLNLISSKENKVSEFRQSWIDGIREEIAAYTAAVQALIRFRSNKDEFESKVQYLEATKEAYKIASESLAKIQLRLNPEHANEKPLSQEARLLTAIHNARDHFNNKDFSAAFDGTASIREAAAPLLKIEWERVKNGEEGYQRIRKNVLLSVRLGLLSFALLVSVSLLYSAADYRAERVHPVAIEHAVEEKASAVPVPLKDSRTDEKEVRPEAK